MIELLLIWAVILVLCGIVWTASTHEERVHERTREAFQKQIDQGNQQARDMVRISMEAQTNTYTLSIGRPAKLTNFPPATYFEVIGVYRGFEGVFLVALIGTNNQPIFLWVEQNNLTNGSYLSDGTNLCVVPRFPK